MRPLIELEYPTWLGLLESAPTESPKLIDGPELEEVIQSIQKIISMAMMSIFAERTPSKPEDLTVEDDIVVRTRSYNLAVRNPGYYQHNRELLNTLFSPFDEECNDVLGFTISEAVHMDTAISDLYEKKLDDWKRRSHELADSLLEEVSKFQMDKQFVPEHPIGLIQELARLSQSERKERARTLSLAWFCFGLEQVFTFSAVELAESCELPPKKSTDFLNRFSLAFGQPPIADSWPARYEPLENTPLIRLPDGEYFSHLMTKLSWALRDGFEEAFKENPGIWNKYEPHRSKIVELYTIDLLKKCMPGAQAYHDLHYNIPNTSGEPVEYQLDGLILYDSTMFLVETKGGAFRSSARRGGAKSLKKDLTTLVGNAHDQAIRAGAYIESADEVKFMIQGNESVTIRKGEFNRLVFVTSTLDDLSAFTPGLENLAKFGVMGSGPLPWAVSLADLRVISELVEFGPQLVHYIECRLRLNSEPISSMDELDYFGHYLKSGLNFEFEMKGKSAGAMLLSFTAEFDDYFLYKMGARKTFAPMPVQALPTALHDQIRALCTKQPRGFVDQACKILDKWKDGLAVT